MTVERQPVVLRDTPEPGLELRDDTEIGIDDAFGSPDRPAVVQAGRALGADHAGRYFQPDPRVDAAVTAPIVLVAGVQDHDLVAEATGGLRPPVGDQGLDRDSSSLSSSCRNCPVQALICLASCRGPVKPSSQSSAYADCGIMPSGR